jgi:hypothetical protein
MRMIFVMNVRKGKRKGEDRFLMKFCCWIFMLMMLVVRMDEWNAVKRMLSESEFFWCFCWWLYVLNLVLNVVGVVCRFLLMFLMMILLLLLKMILLFLFFFSFKLIKNELKKPLNNILIIT